jgi:hypothetical protein
MVSIPPFGAKQQPISRASPPGGLPERRRRSAVRGTSAREPPKRRVAQGGNQPQRAGARFLCDGARGLKPGVR